MRRDSGCNGTECFGLPQKSCFYVDCPGQRVHLPVIDGIKVWHKMSIGSLQCSGEKLVIFADVGKRCAVRLAARWPRLHVRSGSLSGNA